MKTTTDVLNKAAHLTDLARLVNNPQRKERLEVERKDVLRIANGALETGGFGQQARNELLAAKHYLEKAFFDAKKQNAQNEHDANFKRLLAECR